MLQRIRYHRMRGARKQCYGCIGSTLYKPKKLSPSNLDIREEHLAFLHGKVPVTFTEKLIHAVLVHENTHSERQLQGRVWLHQLRYILSKSFRLTEEKAAYQAQIRQLVRHQLRVRSVRLAEAMSGAAYRHMVGFDEARNWVSGVIREAEVEFLVDSMADDECTDDATEPMYKMLESPSAMIAVKDRIALVVFALVGFVIMFSIVLTIDFVFEYLW